MDPLRIAARRASLVAAAIVLLPACGLLRDRGPTSDWHRATLTSILAAEDARDPGAPIFTQALSEPDPTLRAFAIRALGRIGAVDSLPLLVRAVTDEPVLENRLEALFAIGLVGHPSALPVLEQAATTSDDATRAMAARALGMTRDERALLGLLALLKDASPHVRGAAALGLGSMMEGRDDPTFGRPAERFVPLGETMRRDADPEVRWRCAYAVAQARLDDLRPYLVDALNDGEPLVRAFACLGLGRLDPRAENRGLLADALDDESWIVVVEAATALGNDPSIHAFEALRPLLERPAAPGSAPAGHPSHHVRAAVAQALDGYGGVPGFTGVLERALGDPSESVRGAALETLAAVGASAEVVARLEDVLYGRSPAPATAYMRARVTRAASKLPDERGWPIVALLLADPEVPVRTAALAALASFPGHKDESTPRLAAALQERDVALREAAAGSAAALGLETLEADLVAALEDSPGAEFVEARLAAIRALGRLGGLQALPVLRRQLDDGERAVRQAARDEIARLGGTIPVMPRPRDVERLAVPVPGRDFLTGGPAPRVRLETNRGAVVLEMLVDDAPAHATAFLERCRAGFYDGLGFHRLVPGFVVQGLDPRGDGYGTGGVSLRDEINQVRYGRGVAGMPNAGPDTGGCQIFVTFRPQPRLDARYTVFARVVAGMDVVERLDVEDVVERAVVEAVAVARQ